MQEANPFTIKENEVVSRADLARKILRPQSQVEEFYAASLIMCSSCARSRETMQESVDLFRVTISHAEDLLRLHWDTLRVMFPVQK